MRYPVLALGLCAFGGLVVGCSSKERARADSAQALVMQQGQLMHQLTAQRDSVTQVLGQADAFIGKIDSSISKVKGLPKGHTPKNEEGPLQAQVRQRQEMLRRVNALVERARETARQVADLKEREKQLLAENGVLKDSLSADAQRFQADAQQIAQLQGTIEQQAQAAAVLQAKLDDFDKQLAAAKEEASRAYYVIGTEDQLLKEGVIVREGGANLLIKHVGRTLVPARHLDVAAFKQIDTRAVHEISVPDSTKHYQIVSRQSLDDVKVTERNGTQFRGSLEIPDSDKFWAPSKYLIIVQR
jgi:regulator of replication initiation timing